jgi:hypothetical protein
MCQVGDHIAWLMVVVKKRFIKADMSVGAFDIFGTPKFGA